VCDGQHAAEFKLDLPRGRTEYCFVAKPKVAHGAAPAGEDSCNPYSEAKFEEGKCICPFPYTGSTCEQCVTGYVEEKEEDEIGEMHTMCKGDAKSEKFRCNGHGSIQSGKCHCEEHFAGSNCDRCADEEMQYPDCDKEDASDIESTDAREKAEDHREGELEGDAYSGDTTKETDSIV